MGGQGLPITISYEGPLFSPSSPRPSLSFKPFFVLLAVGHGGSFEGLSLSLERLFKEVKRRTRVVGVFPDETSASTLATEIALRSSEEWALRRYLTMDTLQALGKLNPQLSRH
jgi:hypothetical protein